MHRTHTTVYSVSRPVAIAGVVGLVLLALAWLFRSEIVRVVFVEQSNQRAPGARITPLWGDNPYIWQPAANQ